MITNEEIIIRLLAAAVLGGLVGYERERNNQPAGLRTHIILVVGAALAMVLSVNLATEFRAIAPNGDPARLAAQVISGIGFLGVGAIIRYGPNVKGLTTATSMWSMAIVGLAVGLGYYLAGVVTTGILMVTLIAVNFIEKRFIHHLVLSQVVITTVDKREMMDKIRAIIEKHASLQPSLSIRKDLHNKRLKIVLQFKLRDRHTMDGLMEELAGLDGIRSITLE